MKFAVVLISALLLAACGQMTSNPKDAGVNSKSSSSKTEGREESGFEVKVMLDGAELAAYRVSGARTLALNDGGVLTLFLSSNDNKNHLTLHLQGTNTGTYPLPSNDAPPKQGQAKMEFMHDETPPMRIPTEGEVKLEKFGDNQCSGTFRGTGTDIKGGKFSIEGSFSNLGVKTVAAN